MALLFAVYAGEDLGVYVMTAAPTAAALTNG